MNRFVLDASAVLALLNQEKGFEIVEKYISKSIISAVNFAEVVTVLNNLGMPNDQAFNLAYEILPQVIEFDITQAALTAELRSKTKHLGLSLGDRACLSLGKLKNLTILTADTLWAQLNIGISLKFIR